VFAADTELHPDDWLQAVNAYRSSLNLTDTQVLNELPDFLAKEPSKWFKALSSHVVSWSQFCQLFRTVFQPSDNQERVLRGILERVQAPEEPLPTFVAHMLSEFDKLKSSPPEQEKIEMICKHSLEKYRVALYGPPVSSVMDLLLRAHELHAVLGPGGHQASPVRFKDLQKTKPYCFKCSRPGFTSRTCPSCNATSHMASPLTQSPVTMTPGVGEPKAETDRVFTDTQPGRQMGNFRGGRTFHRPSFPQSVVESRPQATSSQELQALGHVEDTNYQAHWNTPLRTKVNFNAASVDATLDTGASISAIRADLIRANLADNAPCIPDGVTWLPIGFMNKCYYQRFVIIFNLSSPFILGMDFMTRASISIHVPSRTVFIDETRFSVVDVLDCTVEPFEGENIMSLDTHSDLLAKVAEASIGEGQKSVMVSLITQYDNMFDGHLGRTSLTECD